MGSWPGCNVPVSARLERSEAIQAQFQIGESNVRWVPAFKTAAINTSLYAPIHSMPDPDWRTIGSRSLT
jgi:hypothetical protein